LLDDRVAHLIPLCVHRFQENEMRNTIIEQRNVICELRDVVSKQQITIQELQHQFQECQRQMVCAIGDTKAQLSEELRQARDQIDALQLRQQRRVGLITWGTCRSKRPVHLHRGFKR
jgi:predicted RNase H-like nuclease (RuvC/YqgF family)